jgi:hypothetical protein
MRKGVVLIVVCVLFMVGVVRADWMPGMPYKMHYPQMPDLSPMGLDVLDGPGGNPMGEPIYSKYLADDFLCTATGPITGIHIWNSYMDDRRLPEMAPLFNLTIFSDIPASESPTGYSMPGQPLWSWYGPVSIERPWANASENFFDPNKNEIVGPDTQVFECNFYIPPEQAFVQQAGQIYWLGVNHSADLTGNGVVDVEDSNLFQTEYPWGFGWKTSQNAFNDDAVWLDVPFYGSPQVIPQLGASWNELIDPRTSESLNLSFVVTPEPASVAFLCGGGVLTLIRSRRRS